MQIPDGATDLQTSSILYYAILPAYSAAMTTQLVVGHNVLAQEISLCQRQHDIARLGKGSTDPKLAALLNIEEARLGIEYCVDGELVLAHLQQQVGTNFLHAICRLEKATYPALRYAVGITLRLLVDMATTYCHRRHLILGCQRDLLHTALSSADARNDA